MSSIHRQHSSCNGMFKSLTICLTAILTLCNGQTTPNCPLLGPVFPAPRNVLDQPNGAISLAAAKLQQTLDVALLSPNGTLHENENASFHISSFSIDETVFSYSFAAPGLNGSLTSGVLDNNTIFRIGSVSKLLTVYTLLAEVGMSRMNDPVTKWVPELAKITGSNAVESTQWQDITIGALASQMGGISRDYSLGDLSGTVNNNESIADTIGLPLLSVDEVPICGTSSACSRADFFRGLQSLHPLTSSYHTPIYSNIAYQILAYALEGMTNKTFASSFNSALLQPLGLTRTSLEAPSLADNAIIPGSAQESWWSITTGDESPMGGMFSTASDLTALGQSILNSTLLLPRMTRAWLKPATHTADLHMSVGMPWEIRRMDLPLSSTTKATRIADLYTKNGDLGSYSAVIALSPDHGMGFVILIAGLVAETTARNAEIGVLADIVADAMVPAFEAAAREQAGALLAGTYSATEVDTVTNTTKVTTMVLAVDDARPGLGVTSWKGGEADLLSDYALLGGVPSTSTPSLRLYPMGLEGGDGQVAFRGVYEVLGDSAKGSSSVGGKGLFTTGCLAWGAVDSPTYGNVGFDDFVFDVDAVSGMAMAISPRVARVRLLRSPE